MTHLAMLLKLVKEARSCLGSDSTEAPHSSTADRIAQLRLDLDWIAGTIENHLFERATPTEHAATQLTDQRTNRRL